MVFAGQSLLGGAQKVANLLGAVFFFFPPESPERKALCLTPNWRAVELQLGFLSCLCLILAEARGGREGERWGAQKYKREGEGGKEGEREGGLKYIF